MIEVFLLIESFWLGIENMHGFCLSTCIYL